MTVDPSDMTKAEDEAYWLELEDGSHTIYQGDTKEESEAVFEGGEWFAGAIQEIDRSAGEYGDSRLYKLRNESVDGAILLWGKADINRKFDNAALESGDTVAIKFAGTQDVGEENDMHVYNVRYERL